MQTSGACEGTSQMMLCRCSGPWRASVVILPQERRLQKQGATCNCRVMANRNCTLLWWPPLQVTDLRPLHP